MAGTKPDLNVCIKNEQGKFVEVGVAWTNEKGITAKMNFPCVVTTLYMFKIGDHQ